METTNCYGTYYKEYKTSDTDDSRKQIDTTNLSKCNCTTKILTTQLSSLDELIKVIVFSNPNSYVHCGFKSRVGKTDVYWIFYGNSRELIYAIVMEEKGNLFILDIRTGKIRECGFEEIEKLNVYEKIVYFADCKFSFVDELLC